MWGEVQFGHRNIGRSLVRDRVRGLKLRISPRFAVVRKCGRVCVCVCVCVCWGVGYHRTFLPFSPTHVVKLQKVPTFQPVFLSVRAETLGGGGNLTFQSDFVLVHSGNAGEPHISVRFALVPGANTCG